MNNELTETQRQNLLSKAINSVNNFYYEQMDKNRITGEITIVIDAGEISHDEYIILGERIREYFDNIYEPRYPNKKFHIKTIWKSPIDQGIGIHLKWGRHAEIANREPRHISLQTTITR